MNSAFSAIEQKKILSSTVTADKNPNYGTSPGNDTTDKVFLLSITEVNRYFSSSNARQCKGTAYCYAQGAFKHGNGNCWWLLRTPGRDLLNVAYVSTDGAVSDGGGYVSGDLDAVRPALWVNPNS